MQLSLALLEPALRPVVLQCLSVLLRPPAQGAVFVPHAVSQAIALDPPHRLVPLAGLGRIARALAQLRLDVAGRGSTGGGGREAFAVGENRLDHRLLGPRLMANIGQLAALGLQAVTCLSHPTFPLAQVAFGSLPLGTLYAPLPALRLGRPLASPGQ